MKIFIKNMVCYRCIMVVEQELTKIGITFSTLVLGEVDICNKTTILQINAFKDRLLKVGLELIENKRAILTEKIKYLIEEQIRSNAECIKVNFSNFLSDRLNLNYTYLADVFSDMEGITLEHYFIYHRIQYVKELLEYNELSIKEISYRLNFSSVSHLSSQFKRITGNPPSVFKNHSDKRMLVLEN